MDELVVSSLLFATCVDTGSPSRISHRTPVQLYGVRDSLPDFHDKVPPEDVVSTQVFVPVLSPHGRSFVEVHTYAGKWLAIIALSTLVNAELRMGQLAADQATERKATLDKWAVALLELVILFRLHSEADDTIGYLDRVPPPPVLVSATWTSLGRTAHSVDETLYATIRDSLERRQLEGQAASDDYDTVSWGSFAECSSSLEGWIRATCKLDVPGLLGQRERYLRSICGEARILFEYLYHEVSPPCAL